MSQREPSDGKATRTKRLLRGAVVLAQKQASLAGITSVALPKIYHAIGKRLSTLKTLPGDLEPFRVKVLQLENQLAIFSDSVAPSPAPGLAAKAKSLASKASKAASDASANVQLQAAYVALGKEAIAKHGPKAAPKDLRQELVEVQAKVEALAAEIAGLQEAGQIGLLTPRRIVSAGIAITLATIGVVAWRTISQPAGGQGSFFAPSGQEVASQLASSVAKSARSARDNDAPPEQGENPRALARGLSDRLVALRKDWQATADALDSSLNDEPALQALRDELGRSPFGSSSWVSLADREIEPIRDMSQQVYKSLLKQSYDRPAAIEGKRTSTSRDADESALAFQRQCEQSVAEMRAVREKAVGTMRTHFEEYMTARKRLLSSAAKVLGEEISRWQKGVRALRDSPLALSAIDDAAKPTDSTALSTTVQSLENDWLSDLEEKDKSIRSQRDDALQRFAENLSPESLAAGEKDLERSRESLAKSVTLGLTQLTSGRERNVAELEQRAKAIVQAEVARATAEQQARRKPNRTVSVPDSATDQDIMEIVLNAPDITGLDLSRCELLTDKCFDALARLPHLRHLRLPDVESLTSVGVRKLEGLKLEHYDGPVRFYDDPISFGVLMRAEFGHERASGGGFVRLNHMFRSYGDEGLKNCEGVTIHTLHLPLNGISDAGLKALGKIKELAALEVQLTSKMSDDGLAALRACKSLRRLRLVDVSGSRNVFDRQRPALTSKGIAALNGMQLVDFVIPGWLHTEECLPHYLNACEEGAVHAISFAPRKVESGREWPATERSLSSLAQRKGITRISIDGEGLQGDPDKVIAHLCAIPELEDLTIENTGLTGTGLSGIGGVGRLRRLSLVDNVALTDTALKFIGNCEALTELTIYNAPLISAEGLMALTTCSSLRSVRISGTKVRVGDGVALNSKLKECGVIVE